MKKSTKKILIILTIILLYIYMYTIVHVTAQTVSTPSNVSLTNDGYNKVTIDTVGAKKALAVNVIQSVGSSGSATTYVSGGTITAYVSNQVNTVTVSSIPSVTVISMPSITIISVPTTTIQGTVSIDSSQTFTVKTTASTSFTGNQIIVTNVATLIVAANDNRKSLLVRNQGTTDMYVLNSGVTTTNGILVKINDVLILDRTTAGLYGIVSSGSTTVGYLEE